MHADELLGDALRRRQGVGETRGGFERRKSHDPFRPGMPRRERDLDFRDDAVDAVGVHHLERFATL